MIHHPPHPPVLCQYCPSTLSVLPQYCLSTVSVVPPVLAQYWPQYCLSSFLSTASVLSQYCLSTVSVLPQYCPQYCLSTASVVLSVLSQYCPQYCPISNPPRATPRIFLEKPTKKEWSVTHLFSYMKHMLFKKKSQTLFSCFSRKS